MRLGIVAQPGNDRAVALAADLLAALDGDDVDAAVDEETAGAIDRAGTAIGDMATYPLVVSVGGDGTFLWTARHVGATPILGVNVGEVGFLNPVAPSDAVDVLRAEVERIRETGAPRFREVVRIGVSGEGWSLPPGLNEITVQGAQRGHGQGVDLEVRVDGGLYASGHADGVLVATPTGSTAYNLSEAGPLVHPDAEGLVINEMVGRDAMPPLVVPTDRTVTVRATGADAALVASDGNDRQWITPPATVTIRAAEEPARIAGPPADFFRALNKLE